MDKLKGKRLLILGGTTLLKHVVEIAKSLGVYTIVTDMDPNSPAKKYADKAYNVSTGDMDAMIALAKKERIDGIFTGYEDFNTSVACKLCSILGLPFYATQEQIDLTKNKICFKNTCRKYGIPVVQEYVNDDVVYPVVTKPADSYSGKGILICNNEAEYEYGKQFARQFSKTDQYIVEKFMDSRTVECVNIDYLIKDGEIKLSFIGDKYVNDEQGNKTPLTSAVIYPSAHQKEYIDTLNNKVISMFKALGFKHGTLFIESFYDKEGFHFYEMGYRVGGGQSSILLNKLIGVDYVKMLIEFALTGNMCDDVTFEKVDANIEGVACGLLLLAKSGTISKIDGASIIPNHPNIVKFTQYLYEGDVLESRFEGTLGQAFARIHIVSKNMKDFYDTIIFIRQHLKVYDINGNNMLLSCITSKMESYIKNNL